MKTKIAIVPALALLLTPERGLAAVREAFEDCD